MEQNGVVRFFEEAGLSMEDIIVFIFSYEAKAEVMGEFKKEEFVRGMSVLRVKNTKEFGAKAEEIRTRFKKGSLAFNELYKFVFGFYSAGKKSISGEEAAMLLGLLNCNAFPQGSSLIKFLSENEAAKKEAIFKDTWNMIHYLLKNTQPDGSGYNPEDAWPLLIVNFMETVNKK